MQSRRMLAALFPILLAATGVQAGEAERPPGAAVDSALSSSVTPRIQSEVLVLGSWHTGSFKILEERHLHSTLDLLDRFAPTRIAVESLPPDEIALLLERAPRQPAAAQLLEMFGKHITDAGHAMQSALEVGRLEAEARARELLADAGAGMAPAARAGLVGHLLASYEYYSALLQWSYLDAEARAAAGLPDGVRESLDERLRSKDEIVTLAMAMARRHGLQRLYPIDSHYEAVRTMEFPEKVMDAVFGDPSIRAWRDRPAAAGMRMLPKRAQESGDLLPLLREVNSFAVQEDDATQWRAWLAMDHPSGLDRFRYAMWELRNERMASGVLDAAASTRPERVLVVVGFAHKSYLDRELAGKLALRLVQLDALEARDEP